MLLFWVSESHSKKNSVSSVITILVADSSEILMTSRTTNTIYMSLSIDRDMAARHRARGSSIQIMKVEVIPASKCRRPHMKQYQVSVAVAFFSTRFQPGDLIICWKIRILIRNLVRKYVVHVKNSLVWDLCKWDVFHQNRWFPAKFCAFMFCYN